MGIERRKVWAALAVTALVVAGCSDDGDDGATTDPTDASTTTTTATVIEWPTPEFIEGECPMPLDGVEVEVTCGTVDVPENRLDPESRTITLAVARLHARTDDPRPDPVVQLEGGPGFASLEDVDSYAQATHLDDRDYVLWDQRGTGFSEPNLDCTEVNAAIWSTFETTDPATDEQRVIEDAGRACRERRSAVPRRSIP